MQFVAIYYKELNSLLTKYLILIKLESVHLPELRILIRCIQMMLNHFKFKFTYKVKIKIPKLKITFKK